MRTKLGIFLSVGMLHAALAAEPTMDHSMHQGGSSQAAPDVEPAPEDHSMHNAAPTPETGTSAGWAYTGRVNPPSSPRRWKMMPVPGYGHMFISTANINHMQVCAALNTPGMMLDRATQKYCGIIRPPAKASTGAGHDKH